MIQIEYQVAKQVLKRSSVPDTIAAYAKDYNFAHFTFDEDWEGLNVTVIFEHRTRGRFLVIPDGNMVATIPTEVLGTPGFSVSVFGTDSAGKRITTTLDHVAVMSSGVDAPEYPTPPTPGIYEQILAVAQSVRNDADAGKFDGPPGPPGTGSEPATTESPGTVRPDGVTLDVQGEDAEIFVKDGAITSQKLAEQAVLSANIADKAVGYEKLGDKAVGFGKIADDAIVTENVQDQAITSEKLHDGAVGMSKLSGEVLDKSGGIATFDLAYKTIEDLAVLRFDAEMSTVVADQTMNFVHVWEFPEDVELKSGYYDSSGDKYYAEVE